MENILIILLLVALAGMAIALLFKEINRKRKIQELAQKTHLAASGESLHTVDFTGESTLKQIADNFNTLGDKFTAAKSKLGQFGEMKEEKNLLGDKVKKFESSISQIQLLTDIGKDLTSSLGFKEILDKLFNYIQSSMVAEEVHLMVDKQGKRYHYVLTQKEKKLIEEESWTLNKDNALNWTFANNKEIILRNASRDFGQYVFKPITLYGGEAAQSVIALPFGFRNKLTGSLAVLSKRPNAYDDFHQDFIISLASYFSVAIENANLFGELNFEKKKSDDLLLNILPNEVAEELKQKGSSAPRLYDSVSVLFTDFVNFTGIAEKLSPKELVSEIDHCFRNFDSIVEKIGLEKIKTIGDAYLAVGGLPIEDPLHAEKTIQVAIEVLDFMEKRKKEGGLFDIRIGINSGPVVAGIVGSKKFAFDIWGDTVNVASRLEGKSEAGKINISGTTYNLCKDKFNYTYRGKVEVKNKGLIDMYFVNKNLGQE